MSRVIRDGYVFLTSVNGRYMLDTVSLKDGVESSERTQVLLTIYVNDVVKAKREITKVLTQNYERCLDYDGNVFAGDSRNMIIDIFTWWANNYSLTLPPTIPHIDHSIDIEALIEQKINEKLQNAPSPTPDLIALSSDDTVGLSEMTIPRTGCVGLIEFVDKVKDIIAYDDDQQMWLKIVVDYVGDNAFETEKTWICRPGANGSIIREIKCTELPREYDSIKPSSSIVRRWSNVMNKTDKTRFVIVIKNLAGVKQSGGKHYYVPDLMTYE